MKIAVYKNWDEVPVYFYDVDRYHVSEGSLYIFSNKSPLGCPKHIIGVNGWCRLEVCDEQ